MYFNFFEHLLHLKKKTDGGRRKSSGGFQIDKMATEQMRGNF